MHQEHLHPGTRFSLFCTVVTAALVVSLVAGVALGATPMDWRLVVRVLEIRLLPDGMVNGAGVERADDLIVWTVRLPRVLLSALAGGALAVAGAQMQAIFRNPLADPGLVGVGAGAALGGVVAFATGAVALSVYWLPTFAFSGGLLALAVVYAMATRGGCTPSESLLLTGVAVAAILGSVTSFIISMNLANLKMTQEILFWTLGGLDGRSWLHIQLCLPFIVAGFGVALYFSRDLDLLLQGEETALSLGMDAERVKRLVLVSAALLTGAAVAVAGMISFVGLIVPHIVRMILGPSHRRLIPACALTGAVFLMLCDLLARTVSAPEEIRLGVITALWGGPFFLLLLQRRLQSGVPN